MGSAAKGAASAVDPGARGASDTGKSEPVAKGEGTRDADQYCDWAPACVGGADDVSACGGTVTMGSPQQIGVGEPADDSQCQQEPHFPQLRLDDFQVEFANSEPDHA